jgi:hypothetical protein
LNTKDTHEPKTSLSLLRENCRPLPSLKLLPLLILL